MSINRRAAKRDANEPAIVSALEALGCVVWRVSGKGLPDLIVLRAGKTWLADVKGLKEKPTPAQETAWEVAATKARCSVFILRTPEDAQKMLNNALQPWEPEGCANQRPQSVDSRTHLAQIAKSTEATLRARKGDAAKAREEGRKRLHTNSRALEIASRAEAIISGAFEPARNYTPPRSNPVDAAKEAEATFAPAESVTPLDRGGALRSPPRHGTKAGDPRYADFVPPEKSSEDKSSFYYDSIEANED